jgi:hypothetical protein
MCRENYMELKKDDKDGNAELHEMLGEWKMFSAEMFRRMDRLEDEVKNSGPRRAAVAAACVSIGGGIISFANLCLGAR